MNTWPWARWLARAVLGLLLGAVSPSCLALCVTPLCSCTAGTTSVAFAAHNPLSALSNDSAGNVRITCGGVAGLLIPVTVALSKGAGPGFADRRMLSGANALPYNLYTAVDRLTVFGDGTGGSQTVGGGILLDALGWSVPLDVPVYGRIPGGQGSVVPGSYADTIVVTVTYH